MESEGGGLTATPAPERGKKRPPSPSSLPGDEDDYSSKPSYNDDDNGEWWVSGSEEDEDQENQGLARLSLTSLARVISMPTRVLIEFELHALSEDEKGGDDELIIEGCTELNNMFARKSFIEHQRLYSEKCALDLKYAVLRSAVEARVDVEVLRVVSPVPTHGVGLKLHAKTSGFSDVIRLFQGTPSEPGFLTSFAVAVELGSFLDLRLEGSPSDHALGQKPLLGSWWERSFSARFHETTMEPVELGEFAAFSVKVTWKSYEKRSCELHL